MRFTRELWHYTYKKDIFNNLKKSSLVGILRLLSFGIQPNLAW